MAYIKDRRQFARAEVKWPVTILSPEQHTLGEIRNISQLGASVYCREIPSAGPELSLEIQPPNRKSILVFAKTIWAIDADSSEGPHCFVLGVQFKYISEDDIQFLDEIVAKQSH